MRLISLLVFVICGFIKNLYQILISCCYHAKIFKMRHVTSLYFFLVCYSWDALINSILSYGPNTTSQHPSYLFTLIFNLFPIWKLFHTEKVIIHESCHEPFLWNRIWRLGWLLACWQYWKLPDPRGCRLQTMFAISAATHRTQMYLQHPLRQYGASNVYLLVLSKWKVNIA